MKKRIEKYLLLMIIALSIYVFIEPRWLEDKTYIIVNQDIPLKFKNTRIIFISDIHHGPFFDISRVRNLVERVNRAKPDIILLGGDYVHRDAKYIVPCFNELRKLEAPLGVYGVLGNHDHWENAELTKERMAASGIKEIDNRAFWVAKEGERFKIGGVGDYNEDVTDVAPTIFDAQESDFVILLSHNPDYVETLKTDKVDLVLSGHTHGGQVTLFGLWAPLVPSKFGQKYRTGRIDKKKPEVIVSNGIGTITPPVRFFARPQIVTVILKRKMD